MSIRMRHVLMPKYMKSFRCTGSACEDCCCMGWRVDIDQESYKKYKRIKDVELSKLVDKHIIRNRSSNNDFFYAKIKHKSEDGFCPFLSDEKLCRLQLKYGEDYLSPVCATYPRAANIIDGVLEKSATMSCPEVTKIALLNPNIMEFDEAEEPAEIINIVSINIDTQNKLLTNQPHKYLWELRIFTISLLQNRHFTLNERLTILGMFYQKANNHVKEGKVDDIPRLIEMYNKLIAEDSLKESLQTIPSQSTIQMELLKELADERHLIGSITCKRYIECFWEFINGVGYKKDLKIEDIGEKYAQIYDAYYKPFIINHEYILENYLVNYVFKNVFPFTGSPDMFEAYVMMVIHYALIKMHLIGIAGFNEELNVDHVCKLIQSFSRTSEHSRKYLETIAELLRRNGYNTMPYMAILINN